MSAEYVLLAVFQIIDIFLQSAVYEVPTVLKIATILQPNVFFNRINKKVLHISTRNMAYLQE